jgi:enolase
MIQSEEHIPITRVCDVLQISRSEYYRKVKQMCDYTTRKTARQSPQTFAERALALAEKYPLYGPECGKVENKWKTIGGEKKYPVDPESCGKDVGFHSPPFASNSSQYA